MIAFVREFVGYYTSRGPKGYVEAVSKERALALAKLVTQPWDNMQIGAPYQLLFGDTYRVGIEPNE